MARFNQVTGVSDADRSQAFENIEATVEHCDVEVSESSWRGLMQ